jgi:GTP pyrophosphokinase
MIRIDDLTAKVAAYIPDTGDVALLNKAYVYSATLHRRTFTPAGRPALQHALEVSSILADMKLDVACLVAGLLHDVLQESLADPAALREAVGEDVARLVEEVSALSRASFHGTEASRAEHMRQMILASTRDLRVILLLLASRLQTLRSLGEADLETRTALARETLVIYAPIAHRLGIQYLKAEMEDLAFAILDPPAFAELKAAVEARIRARSAPIEQINTELRALLEQQGIRAEVVGRAKHLYSIHHKMLKNKIGLDRIYDILATRIIVKDPDECYKVLGLIHANFTPIPGRFKDYIALPKANGYQSLHTSVFAASGDILEIQIRTEKMHREAELGIAAHFSYKDGSAQDARELASVSWFRTLLENLEVGKDPRESMDLLSRDLSPDEIFLFTPQGEVVKLPAKATPIDFAYAVHSEVGNHCTGAKMDGKIVSLRTPLRNGSVVEILTSAKQVPNEDWLKFAVSSKALGKIRTYLRNQERAEALRLGREIFLKEGKRVLRKPEDLFRHDAFRDWMQKNNLHNPDEVYVAEGFGHINLRVTLERLFPPEEKSPAERGAGARPAVGRPGVAKPGSAKAGLAKQGPAGKQTARRTARNDLVVAGIENLMVRFAKCCAPVHGDPLLGIITRGRGVSVHHRDCAALARQVYHELRVVDAQWADEAGAQRPVTLAIRATTSMKHLLSVIPLLEEEGTPVTSGHITAKQGVYTQQLTLLVEDSRQLKRILQRLNAIAGIRAERVLESA